VPLRVDRRLDSFPGRSDGAGIKFLHEKLDLFRKAQWFELLGIRTEQADRHTDSSAGKTSHGPDARENDWKAMRMSRVKHALFIGTCLAFLYAVVPRPPPPWRRVRSILE
jgi:hypothetical protein